MKKILVLFILVTVIFGLYSEENLLWCKKMLFNEPTTHVIQKGDYFSKLSQQYYGTAKYWQQLALINRAPNKDMVFPGEKVVIPSLEAIKKLRESRSLTSVNDIVKVQKDWIAEHGNVTTQYAFETTETTTKEQVTATDEQAPAQKTAIEQVPITQSDNFEPEPVIENEYEKSSMLPVILTIAAVVLIVGIMSLYLYRRKKKYELEEFEPVEKEEDTLLEEDDEEVNEVYTDPFAEPKHEREREQVLVN